VVAAQQRGSTQSTPTFRSAVLGQQPGPTQSTAAFWFGGGGAAARVGAVDPYVSVGRSGPAPWVDCADPCVLVGGGLAAARVGAVDP